MEDSKQVQVIDGKVTAAELRELGMEGAANELEAKQELARKLMIAYENYRFVKQEKIDGYNRSLYERTLKTGAYGSQVYDKLQFTDLPKYSTVPPRDVLDSLKKAKEHGCFDSFEVAKIESVEVRPDPILFGRVRGCQDRFYVAQWDNDIRIEDLIGPDEG